MSFQKILEEMRKKEGIESIVFLDSDGETIWSCGSDDPGVLRLAAAHQSVLFNSIRRLGVGVAGTVFAGHQGRWILTHRLKDGYLITVIFSADLNYARAHFVLGELYRQLEDEL